jgi:L-glyceraldehyde 3-phosphate reductase
MNTPTDRYNKTPCRPSGKSGLGLPVVSLGLWHNFGGNGLQDMARDRVWGAFDAGITHFDLALIDACHVH